MDVETRELTYFVAVAEELHFGRAAERLGIAQPPLSRAIGRLERRLGVVLLERTSRRVTLTDAGRTLYAESKVALNAITSAVNRTRRAATPNAPLVLAMKPGGDGGLLTGILDAYRHEEGSASVDVRFSFGERAAMLCDGRADVALLYAPRENLDGFATEPLLVERQVVVMSQRHRLATRPHLCLADLANEVQPRWPHLDGPADGPEIREAGQLMQLVALGRTVAVLPESIRSQLRDDVVAIPVPDAPPTTLVLAWPEQARGRALATFVRTAAAVAGASRNSACL